MDGTAIKMLIDRNIIISFCVTLGTGIFIYDLEEYSPDGYFAGNGLFWNDDSSLTSSTIVTRYMVILDEN